MALVLAWALAATGQGEVWTVIVAGGMLAPPPLPALPKTLGTGGEGGLETVTVAVVLLVAFTLAAGMVTVICVAVTVAATVV